MKAVDKLMAVPTIHEKVNCKKRRQNEAIQTWWTIDSAPNPEPFPNVSPYLAFAA